MNNFYLKAIDNASKNNAYLKVIDHLNSRVESNIGNRNPIMATEDLEATEEIINLITIAKKLRQQAVKAIDTAVNALSSITHNHVNKELSLSAINAVNNATLTVQELINAERN